AFVGTLNLSARAYKLLILITPTLIEYKCILAVIASPVTLADQLIDVAGFIIRSGQGPPERFNCRRIVHLIESLLAHGDQRARFGGRSRCRTMFDRTRVLLHRQSRRI